MENISAANQAAVADDEKLFVMTRHPRDTAEAVRCIKQAQSLQRPLVLQGLYRAEIKKFSMDGDLYTLPPDIKIFSDDALLGAQSLCEWNTHPMRYRRGGGSLPAAWGGIASIMTGKEGKHTNQWKRFMKDDLAAFREKCGFAALQGLGDAAFGRQAISQNVLVTGYEVKERELKSDAHQDEYENIMLVTTGRKIWALAKLDPDEIPASVKKGGLKDSLQLNAVDMTKNKTAQGFDLARRFDCVQLEAGDVIYVPANIWHQVNSDPSTLAFTLMYMPEALAQDEPLPETPNKPIRPTARGRRRNRQPSDADNGS